MKSKHQESYNKSNQEDLNDLEYYQDVLNEEKDIKMDFSFDDFTKLVEEKEVKSKVDHPRSKQMMFWIGSIAACSLLSLAVFNYFSSNPQNEMQNRVSIIYHQLNVSRFTFDLIPQEKSKVEEQNFVDEVAKVDNSITYTTKKDYKKEENQLIQNNVTAPIENSKELVVVNGEEVEDPIKAQQIALDALKLFASNFSKGTDAIDNLKKISVEF